MRANEFIKKFGWKRAKEIVDGWIRLDFDDSYHIAEGVYCNLPFEPTDNCGTLSLFDLKRLVKSYELVERIGGLKKLKAWVVSEKQRLPISSLFHRNTTPEWRNIEIAERAIADVESCL